MRLAFVFLLLAAAALIVARIVRFAQPQEVLSRIPLFTVPVLWAAAGWIVHRLLNRVRPERDPLLLPTAMLLTGWGMLLIWRLSPTFGARQTAWFVVSVGVLVEVLRGPADLRWLRRYRTLWLTGGLILLALTLIFGTHPSGGQPRLWLGCCGLYFQPSEPLRLLLIAYLASLFAERAIAGSLHHRRRWLIETAPLLLVWGLSTALLLVQRDLGAGTLLVVLLASMLFVATGRWQVLAAALALALLGGALGYAAVDVVRQRVDSWLNPWLDPIGHSYQVVQSLIAIAAGGILGRGPGMGSPTLVPVVHTDTIYAAVAEEWGLAGTVGLIALLAVLVSRGLRAAARAREPFAAVLAAGVSLSIGIQAILIIGGVIRLLPLTGVTLPFVSYGGSSLLTSYVSLAFLLLISGEEGRPGPFKRPLLIASAGLLTAWLALAVGTGWWSLYRAPALAARTDNARRALAALISPRGRIVDRHGQTLAETVGVRGSYRRTYPEPSVYSLVGYDSMAYAQAGVEAAMDAALRGESGHGAWTIWWSRLLTGAPPPGLDVRLTIDLDLQTAAASALDPYRGAVVVANPVSGDILAMVSSPTYDPNRLDADWQDLVRRADAPLLNRATQGVFQPGPAIGPLLLAWAERQGLVSAWDVAPDPERPLSLNGRTVQCSQSPGQGSISYGLAVRMGCPSVLAALGTRLGGDGLESMASAFGLDQAPAVGIESADVGPVVLPDEAEALSLAAAGQGTLTVTPLQLLRAFCALVAGGDLPRLRLFEDVRTPGGEWMPVATREIPSAALPGDVAEDVAQALRIPGNNITGLSAQALVGPAGETVAWFLGATMDKANPLTVVVLLEQATPAEARAIGLRLLRFAFP